MNALPTAATTSAAAPPSAARKIASVTSCAAMRRCDPPSAMRTPISRRRRTARASMRFAAFEQAMRNTRTATAPSIDATFAVGESVVARDGRIDRSSTDPGMSSLAPRLGTERNAAVARLWICASAMPRATRTTVNSQISSFDVDHSDPRNDTFGASVTGTQRSSGLMLTPLNPSGATPMTRTRTEPTRISPSHDRAIAAELPLPEVVAEHRDGLAIRQPRVVSADQPPERRRHAERREVVAVDHHRLNDRARRGGVVRVAHGHSRRVALHPDGRGAGELIA